MIKRNTPRGGDALEEKTKFNKMIIGQHGEKKKGHGCKESLFAL